MDDGCLRKRTILNTVDLLTKWMLLSYDYRRTLESLFRSNHGHRIYRNWFCRYRSHKTIIAISSLCIQ